MLRKLLACLALLTGLAAAGAPAQASVAVAVASRMEASNADGATARGQATALRAARPALRKAAPVQGSRPSLRAVLRVPTVQLGIDRARE